MTFKFLILGSRKTKSPPIKEPNSTITNSIQNQKTNEQNFHGFLIIQTELNQQNSS